MSALGGGGGRLAGLLLSLGVLPCCSSWFSATSSGLLLEAVQAEAAESFVFCGRFIKGFHQFRQILRKLRILSLAFSSLSSTLKTLHC